METNHRIITSKPMRLSKQLSGNSGQLNSTVPCNGCVLCCQGDAIRILPEDAGNVYDTVPHDHFPGELMLAHKPNGDCVYLGPDGCTIHNGKPWMCKTMDCRNLARNIKKKDCKKYNLPVRVWNHGRQMIGRSY